MERGQPRGRVPSYILPYEDIWDMIRVISTPRLENLGLYPSDDRETERPFGWPPYVKGGPLGAAQSN